MEANSIDVCLTFDTTGSMYPCLSQARRHMTSMVSRLFTDIPDLRIAIIAHGDYCDARSSYVTRSLDFSKDQRKICTFINSVEPTGGGDAPECYELVLHEARTELTWHSGRNKVIVMIGDDIPHGPSYPGNTKRIDWRNELGLLLEANINVYGVHAMPGVRKHSKHFYEEIAQKTGGFYITLDQFASVGDLIMAICYQQQGPDQFQSYVAELSREGKLNRGLRTSFARMSGETHTEEATVNGLVPVPSGRFQVMAVDTDIAIKAFVESQGVKFQAGRGFYELFGKTVEVQRYKEIVLQDKATGDLFVGSEARSLVGLSPEDAGDRTIERLKPSDFGRFKVFIQSTSFNRKLLSGTSFLYEVEDWRREE